MPTSDRRDDQRRPIAEARVLQQQIGRECAHHVLGAVAEVDDVEHAEDHGEPEAQQRVERAVDQPDQQLAEQRRRGDAEDFEHANGSPSGRRGGPIARPSLMVPRSAAHQRAAAVLERTERLVRRDRGAHVVEVARDTSIPPASSPRTDRLVHLAAVGADRALAEQRIVGRHLLHLGDHRLAVGRALQRRHRLEVVQ